MEAQMCLITLSSVTGLITCRLMSARLPREHPNETGMMFY